MVLWLQKVINGARDGNSVYLEYVGTIKPQTKITVSRKLLMWRDLKIGIGQSQSGFYTDELEKQIEEKQTEIKDKYIKNLVEVLIISLLITIAF